MYLNEFTELQYSALICALIIFESNDEYSTTQQLLNIRALGSRGANIQNKFMPGIFVGNLNKFPKFYGDQMNGVVTA